jgi:thiol-disulfide isomerase/thioredoxin
LSKEFEDKEREALTYYKKVASAFPGTDAGEKAAGAVRRLESVGRRVELEGQTITGKPFKLSALRGKPVVLHYWATWCEPCKQDMKLLRRLQASYQRAGLQLVGVNVDVTRDLAEGFLNEAQLPWVQLFEKGGLESSGLAKAFGVQTLPTMLLIDADGKVVRHNVRAAELDEEIDLMLKR